jgi:transcriptional regulator with XRE-family HTH domain
LHVWHYDKSSYHRQGVFVKKEKISFHGAARLREERERLGLSQQDAEALWGISRVTWGKYERGDTTPDAAVLAAIAAAGADVLYIVTGSRSAPVAPALSRDEVGMLDSYRHCSKEMQLAARTQLAAMAQPGVKKKAA